MSVAKHVASVYYCVVCFLFIWI